MWLRRHTLCYFPVCTFYVGIATHVDTTDVAANIAGVGKKKHKARLSWSTFTVLAETAHPVFFFKNARGAGWILNVIYHMSAHCSVHT